MGMKSSTEKCVHLFLNWTIHTASAIWSGEELENWKSEANWNEHHRWCVCVIYANNAIMFLFESRISVRQRVTASSK